MERVGSGGLTRGGQKLAARRSPSRLYPRLLLDISGAQLGLAALACALAWRRKPLAAQILDRRPGHLVCFSVRSAFDLLLEALDLPAESEVVFSAVTHPDMTRIAKAHRLRAIPVDLDLDTLAPRPDLLEHALSERTRVIVVAHLFGGRVDLAPIAQLARAHGLLLVEDCAQSLRDPSQMDESAADVSMFSFGTIKTATALGGALVRVSDDGIARRMRSVEARWPVQQRFHYLRKVLKVFALVLIGRPRRYALLARATRDLDALVNGSVRAFPGQTLLAEIRRRPSAPLLWLLARRLRTFDGARVRRRADAGEHALKGLPTGLAHPGAHALDRTHWVFPVLSADPRALVARLRSEGFDAATATSGITVVPAPADQHDLRPTEAERMMASVVFLPVYPELPVRERDRMLEVLH